MDKVVASAAEAVADIPEGASIASGGFGISGIPTVLIDAIVDRGVTELVILSNNCGTDGVGLGNCWRTSKFAASSPHMSARTRSSSVST